MKGLKKKAQTLSFIKGKNENLTCCCEEKCLVAKMWLSVNRELLNFTRNARQGIWAWKMRQLISEKESEWNFPSGCLTLN